MQPDQEVEHLGPPDKRPTRRRHLAASIGPQPDVLRQQLGEGGCVSCLHRVAVTTGGYRQASLDYAEVNGEPAMLVRLSGQLDGLFVMSVVNGQIATIRVVRNPDKLRFIERQLPARLM